MTREEAIKILRVRQEYATLIKEQVLQEAIDMAISALEQKNTYADVINSTDNKVYSNIHNAEPFGYHSAEQTEPSETHDREWIIGCIKHDGFIKTDRFDKANQIILEALSATNDEKVQNCGDFIRCKDCKWYKNCEYFDPHNAPCRLTHEIHTETHECVKETHDSDLISRAELIEAIEDTDWYHINRNGKMVHGSNDEYESWYKYEDIYKAIDRVPSVSAERVGEWEEHELFGNPWYTCSLCNYHGSKDYHYCPNCGAKMKGGAE